MAVQSTSPYYAGDAFWCIHETVKQEMPFVYPYHVQVPSFGDWGFQLASKTELQIEELTLQQEGKFLTQDNLQGVLLFGEDERSKKELEVNYFIKSQAFCSIIWKRRKIGNKKV